MFVTLCAVGEAAPSVPVCERSGQHFCMFQSIHPESHMLTFLHACDLLRFSFSPQRFWFFYFTEQRNWKFACFLATCERRLQKVLKFIVSTAIVNVVVWGVIYHLRQAVFQLCSSDSSQTERNAKMNKNALISRRIKMAIQCVLHVSRIKTLKLFTTQQDKQME